MFPKNFLFMILDIGSNFNLFSSKFLKHLISISLISKLLKIIIFFIFVEYFSNNLKSNSGLGIFFLLRPVNLN